MLGAGEGSPAFIYDEHLYEYMDNKRENAYTMQRHVDVLLCVSAPSYKDLIFI